MTETEKAVTTEETDLAENELICDLCGCVIETDEEYFVENSHLCGDCYEDSTSVCSCCGERIFNSNTVEDYPDTLCMECYYEYYTRCARCDSVIHNDRVYYCDDENDDPYCECCYRIICGDNPIHSYGYKPEPIFYGEGKRFFGVELEIDNAGTYDDYAKEILEAGNENEEHLYIKTDGSLSEGLEIVTHPMTADYHKNKMPWDKITRKAISLGYLSHKTSTCGLHVHVNRNSLGFTENDQEETISRILFFVEKFWNELLVFSRRTPFQVERWAARYGFKDQPKEIMKTAKAGRGNRYTCVNIAPLNTIEFRMFRGTLKTNTIIATVQLVDKICTVAYLMSDDSLSKLSWPEFVASIKEPELITYLKERRLYINDEIAYTEDD